MNKYKEPVHLEEESIFLSFSKSKEKFHTRMYQII